MYANPDDLTLDKRSISKTGDVGEISVISEFR
jgi:hypothetical protein